VSGYKLQEVDGGKDEILPNIFHHAKQTISYRYDGRKYHGEELPCESAAFLMLDVSSST